MNADKLIVGILASTAALAAFASGPVPLGSALGIRLGEPLGEVLGSVLPIAGGGLLTVAAVSLVIGIRVVRRKRDHQAAALPANGVKE